MRQQSESYLPGGLKWQPLLWSGLLLAVAAVLRLYCLGQNSLWVDEFASLAVARAPLAEIPAAALRGDAFEPPLYFWLLHLVIGALGDSETALRLLSAVAGALTIPLMALLIRGLGESAQAATLSAALLAVSPLHLWYSQEARPYALLVCLGVGSLVCLTRALRTNGLLAWGGFAVLASLAILTHVFGLVFPLVGWVWAMSTRRDPSAFRSLLAASLGIALLTAPLGYRLTQAIIHAQGTGSPRRQLTGLEIPYTALTYLGGYSFGPSVREIQDEGPTEALLAHPGQSAVLLVVALMLTVIALRLRARIAKHLALLFLLPMMVTWLGAAWTGKAYNVRYTLPGIIGFLGLVALGISGLSRNYRLIAIPAVTGLFLMADLQWFFNPRYRKEDSRSAVAWLRGQLLPGSTVAVAPGYQSGVLTHYAQRGDADLVFLGLPDTTTSLGSPLPDALLITRLHHVPHWRELVGSLRPRAGSSPALPELVGYQAFLIRR